MTNKSAPSLSIIVPHHKDEKNLKALLDSIQQQEMAKDIEVIVVSNPPSKKAETLCALYPIAYHFQSEVVGVNHARNIGIRKSRADLLLFLDSDCKITDSNLIGKHVQLHVQNKNTACIGGLYANSSNRVIDRAYAYNQMLWLYQGIQASTSKYLIGGHFSCKRDLLENELFDENIVFGSSETEFFIRLHSNGKNLKLFTEISVDHHTHLNTPKLIRKLYLQGVGARYLEKKMSTRLSDVSTNFQTTELERTSYSKNFEFWLELMNHSYSAGYGSMTSRIGPWKIFCLASAFGFKYLSKRLLNGLQELAFLLKNFPKD